MNLEYGPEYEDFRAEVIDFCKEYEGISFENTSSKNISRSEWQKILIEKGFIARAIPKEYGGFGGETDIIKSRIIATEFSKVHSIFKSLQASSKALEKLENSISPLLENIFNLIK